MTSTPAIDFRPRSVGELLDLTFMLYRHNFLRLIGITLVVMGPVAAFSLLSRSSSIVQYMASLASLSSGIQSRSAIGTAAIISSLIACCAGVLVAIAGVFVPWMEGALTHNTIEHILGRKPNWRASYTAIRPRWASLWAANALRVITVSVAMIPFVMGLYGVLISIVFAFGASGSAPIANANDINLVSLGLVAICLPVGLVGGALGVYVATSWSMIVPVIVGEGIDATTSLGRSNTLAKGFRIRLIGRLMLFEAMRFFVLTLPILAIQLFVYGGSFVARVNEPTSIWTVVAIIVAGILGSIENVLVAPFYSIYIVVNYLDLRIRKENLALQIQAANLAQENVNATVSVQNNSLDIAESTPLSSAPTVISSPILDAPGLAIVTNPEIQRDDKVIDEANGMPPASTMALPAIEESITPAQRISALFKRLRTEGDQPELMNQLGIAYQEVGDLFGARDSFTRARTLAPDNPVYAYNMAMLHRQRKDLPAAREAMADYLRLETDALQRQTVLADPAMKDLLD